MSILRDIIDMKDDLDDITDDSPLSMNTRGSIAREANPGVLQFPALVSPSLSIEEISMVVKALEREYVSFVSIITSVDSVTDEKSIKSYIQKIHQNVNDDIVFKESSVFSFLPKETLDTINYLRESEEVALGVMKNIKDKDGNCTCYDEENEIVVHYDDLSEDEKEQVLPSIKKTCDKSCEQSSECTGKCDKFSKGKNVNSLVIKESANVYKHIFIIRNIENNHLKLVESVNFPVHARGKNMHEIESKMITECTKALKPYVSSFNMKILNDGMCSVNNYSLIGTGYAKDKYNGLNEKSLADTITAEFSDDSLEDRTYRDGSVTKDILRDNDVKKANELVPTMLHLNTYFKDSNGGLHGVDYMIGVKVIVHPINSDSMVENIVKSVKRGRGFFNLMRLTTGEISFFKDFVFAINRTKDDIKTKYKDNPWWNTLIRRRKYARALKAINAKQQLVPNATIIISMDEVEKMKIEHNIDVMDAKIIKDIMDQLFLLGFVIVDSSVETVQFFFDGQKHYQQYSYAALERENSNSKREVQNIMQVLGRM